MFRLSWWRTLATHAPCWFGMHDWKRATRISDRTGQQVCKHCKRRRDVPLRKAKQSGAVPLEYPKTIFKSDPSTQLPRSQWPPQ